MEPPQIPGFAEWVAGYALGSVREAITWYATLRSEIGENGDRAAGRADSGSATLTDDFAHKPRGLARIFAI